MRVGATLFACCALLTIGGSEAPFAVRSALASTPSSQADDPNPPDVESDEIEPPPEAAHPPAREDPSSGQRSRGPAAEPDALGRPCDEHFFRSCPEGLQCVDSRCAKKPIAAETELGLRVVDRVRPFRLGVSSSFFVGFAGQLKNPQPAYTINADFGFPSGRAIRWHVEIGYEDLNGHTGLKVNPFVLGYTIPLRVPHLPVELEIEIIGAVLQSEVLFGGDFSVALSSGLRAQLVAVYGVGYIGFTPLGFEIRYAYGVETTGIESGLGANWPFQLTLGVEL